MKLLVLVALVLIVAAVLAGRRRVPQQPLNLSEPISSWRITDSWSVGKGELKGKAIFTRFNVGLKQLVGHPAFTKQIGIAVPLNDPTADGLPRGAEFSQLNEIEDAIERRLTAANESLYAGAITTNGMREFVLYTSNADSAAAKAREMADAIEHHRLQVIVNDDPEWKVFKNLAAQ